MKTSTIVVALLAASLGILQADQTSTSAANTGNPDQKGVPAPTAYQVVERGANHKVWQRETYEKLPDGRIVPHLHTYTELATGMHYQNAQGQWVESKEQINASATGAVANQGPYQVAFANNLNSAGAIDQQTPDGRRLRSNILGLSYYDSATGKSVLLAQIQDSQGELISANQVLYPDAFTGLKADVRYTYKRGSFEQDVILREQPPTPESLGLNSATTEIEVMTEFLNPPPAAIVNRPVENNALTDQDVSWGVMSLGHGQAFDLGEPPGSGNRITVIRQYQAIQGRRILLEIVPLKNIQPDLQKLPLQSSINTNLPVIASIERVLPKALAAQASQTPMKLATSIPSNKGYVLDYAELNTDQTDYTFQGDTTYFVTGWVNLGGTTTFEGGTVIKYDDSSWLSLNIEGTLKCKTGPYRPAVFTSRDDDSVGEGMPGSTGSPTKQAFNNLIFYLSLNSAATLSHLRFCYASCAVNTYTYCDTGDVIEIWDSQFVNCWTAFWYLNPNLHNVLFSGCSSVIFVVGLPLTLNAEQVTADGEIVDTLGYYDCTCNFTNSIVGNQAIAGDGNWFSVATPIYEPAGGGSFYLTNNSPCHNAGTANINPALLADLATKTTYPPVIYNVPGVYYTNSLNLFPQALRDTNSSPDLGYHYDPLDYLIGSMYVTNATITMNPGTAVGMFAAYADYGFGIAIANNAHFNGLGAPSNPVKIVQYNTVQELTVPGFVNPWYGSIVHYSSDNYHINCSSIYWSSMAQDMPFIRVSGNGPNNFKNCEFHGGQMLSYYPTLNFTNCLFNRVNSDIEPQDTNVPAFRNNLVYGGTFVYYPMVVTNTVVKDNLFDQALIDVFFGPDGASYDGGHNAYVTNCTTLIPSFTNDLVLNASLAYQAGPLGDFYQPNTSPLINAGSTTADQAGLYHFTTQTNQVKETNSPVDIGYHYLVVDTNGNPAETYWIGIPDYLADTNGDGGLGTWLMHYFGQLGIDPNDDPDGDGLSNLQEYLAGSNPLDLMVLAWGDNSFGECDVPNGLKNAIAVAGNGNGDPSIISAFSVALKADGSLIAWGDNTYGQTNTPIGLNDATAIAAGNYHTLALRSDGTVAVWGSWLEGTTFSTPFVPAGMSNVVAIAAAANHDLAVRTDGSVVAWGYDTNRPSTQVPTNLPPAKAVAAGWYYSAALLTNGTVAVWGSTSWTIPGSLTNVVAISGATFDLLALKADGTVVDLQPNLLLNFPEVSNVVAIADGYWPGLALNNDGSVLVLSNSISLPVYPLEHIKAIGAGWKHALAVRGGRLTPLITVQPANQAVLPGGSATFNVQAIALAGITYQWQFNAVDIPDATNSAFSLTGVNTNAQGVYRAVVSNTAGSIISSNATLTVYDVTPPVLTSMTLPTNQVINYGSNLTLSVTVDAHGAASGFPLYFRWRTNGVNVSSATSSNYTFTVVGSRTCSLVVSNVLGSTNTGWQVTAFYPGGVLIVAQPTNQYQVAGSNVTFIGKGVGSNSVAYQWAFNGTNIAGATNASLILTNVSAAQEGLYNFVLSSVDASIASSNASFTLVTPPIITSQTTPTNRICIFGNRVLFSVNAVAPGMTNGFPLHYQWLLNGTNIPNATTTNYGFTVNDTNGGSYSLAVSNAVGSTNASWLVTVTNAINVTNDLLLIYNSNSTDSSNLCAYYLAHRPMVGGANVLPVACDVGEFTSSTNCDDQIVTPILNWLTNNPTKRPQYVVLFYDIPTRLTNLAYPIAYGNYGGVGYHLHILRSDWQPFVNYINAGSLADCEAYVDKLASFGSNYSPGNLIISASAGGYGNTNYVLDGIRHGAGYCCGEDYSPFSSRVALVTNGLISADVPTNSILFSDGTEIFSNSIAYNLPHPTGVTNVSGYICWGAHSSLGANYATDGTVQWKGNSGWWIIRTLESYNGQKIDPGQGTFVKWFSSNAFGGTNYSNTPIGASSNLEEPGLESSTTTSAYFSLWASGKNFGICAWNAVNTYFFQVVGDPFLTK